jgi:hypothetical protein
MISLIAFEVLVIVKDNYLRIVELKRAHLIALKTRKPVLNISCGETDYGHVNADISFQPVPNFVKVQPDQPLPFPDKFFSVAYSTHTIEHVDCVEKFYGELSRVADHVICIYPIISFLSFNPNHKWIFLDRSTKKYFQNPFFHPFQERFPPNVFIYRRWKYKIKPYIMSLNKKLNRIKPPISVLSNKSIQVDTTNCK